MTLITMMNIQSGCNTRRGEACAATLATMLAMLATIIDCSTAQRVMGKYVRFRIKHSVVVGYASVVLGHYYFVQLLLRTMKSVVTMFLCFTAVCLRAGNDFRLTYEIWRQRFFVSIFELIKIEPGVDKHSTSQSTTDLVFVWCWGETLISVCVF